MQRHPNGRLKGFLRTPGHLLDGRMSFDLCFAWKVIVARGLTLVSSAVQDHGRRTNWIRAARAYDDVDALRASRLRWSNRARYTRRTKKSKLTSRPAISRCFATRPRRCEESVVCLAGAAGNLYLLLLPVPFSRSLQPPAMTWPPPLLSTGNPFRWGRYQTWTNRGSVTRRRRFVALRRNVLPWRHAVSCAEPEYMARGDYNLLNNSDHHRRRYAPCSVAVFNVKKVSTKKTVWSSKMPYSRG